VGSRHSIQGGLLHLCVQKTIEFAVGRIARNPLYLLFDHVVEWRRIVGMVVIVVVWLRLESIFDERSGYVAHGWRRRRKKTAMWRRVGPDVVVGGIMVGYDGSTYTMMMLLSIVSMSFVFSHQTQLVDQTDLLGCYADCTAS
jgi:hypothetical protein